jgi:intracellular multiplication protein IcmO
MTLESAKAAQTFPTFSNQTPLSEVRARTAAGEGWLLFDSSLLADHLETIRRLARECGREAQLLVLDFDAPFESQSIGILDGEPTDIAATLVSLLPVAPEGCAGAEFYRQAAHHALEVLVGALQAAGVRIRLSELSVLLQSADAIRTLESCVPHDTLAYARLQSFMDTFRAGSDATVDVDKLKAILGGMSGRIAMYAKGTFGALCDSANPDIRLDDVVRNNSMLYVQLPAGDALAQQVERVISTSLSNALVRSRRAAEPLG